MFARLKKNNFYYFSKGMWNKTFKISICFCFILVLMIKTTVPATTVFIGYFSKQIKPAALLDQEKENEKTSDSKETISKAKKAADEVFVFVYEYIPVLNRVNLLYKKQTNLFKQTHFPPVLTPPPNAA